MSFKSSTKPFRLSLVIILCLILQRLTFAQEDISKNIIPPSPTAAAFTKYGNIPVSYYNGLPNINIPLYELADRDIKIPISLSYHASGIKVSEEASWVGLGWALNAWVE